MTPVKEIAKGIAANVNLTKDGCHDLPAYQSDNFFLSRWRLTWRERPSVLFGGSVWLYVMGNAHPPATMVFREQDVVQTKAR